ncbi:Chaperone DnaJ, C-terminal [Dillenia turbinata]|uniref:Chaperone DnaJ, C-terminal n=1 Tax=Dillenia turbinata TaxID=194707 RepID=A0AAN8VBS9_9MAGN
MEKMQGNNLKIRGINLHDFGGTTEAPCRFRFALTHLDGRQLLVISNPGEIVEPGQYKAINDKGMPQHQWPFIKGRLYIHFDVVLPDSGTFHPDQCRALETILPPRPSIHLSAMVADECEETTMHDRSSTSNGSKRHTMKMTTRSHQRLECNVPSSNKVLLGSSPDE